MTYVIGLTGGIGCGKTVVSNHFSELGATIVDTDVIARLVVEPGQPALKKLVDAFGAQILQEDGFLDRAALRKVAFSNTDNKAKLDAITHPAIRSETMLQIQQAKTPYCIVVIPLLTAESPFSKLIQRVLVVTTDRETRVKRVMQRSDISRDDVERIMATQLSEQERLDFADDVISNDGSIANAKEQVDQLHEFYLALVRT